MQRVRSANILREYLVHTRRLEEAAEVFGAAQLQHDKTWLVEAADGGLHESLFITRYRVNSVILLHHSLMTTILCNHNVMNNQVVMMNDTRVFATRTELAETMVNFGQWGGARGTDEAVADLRRLTTEKHCSMQCSKQTHFGDCALSFIIIIRLLQRLTRRFI